MADPTPPGASGASPAGWHRDPWGLAAFRWWDGRAWTGWTSPGAAPPGVAEAPAVSSSAAASVAAPPLGVAGAGPAPVGSTALAGPPPPVAGGPYRPAASGPFANSAEAAFPVGYGYVPVASEPERPVAEPATPVEPSRRRRLTIEIVIVLAVFPLPYVLTAVAALLESVLAHSSSGRIPLPVHGYPVVSLFIDVVLILEPIAAAALVWYLLSASGEGGLRAIGLDRRYPRTDAALVLPVFFFCFLLPLLGGAFLLTMAGVHGISPSQQHLPTYFSLLDALSAVQAGVVEEIVVLGYLVRRLEQRGMSPAAVVAIAVAVRVSYHLYYGWGVLPFIVWALLSVLFYRRFRRLGPFIAVHILWDLGVGLTPFFHGVPIAVETALLFPSTLVFWLLWRDRLPLRPRPAQSGIARGRAG